VDLRGFVEKHPRARRVDRIDLFSNYLLGGPPSSYDYPLTATQRWIMRGRAIARMDTEIRPTVALTWQASMKNRSWGPEYNIRFARIAIAEGWRVVILHNRSLAPDTFGSLSNHPQLIDLSAQLTIEDLLHVTSAVDVMVAPDTGTAHLAEAVKTKSVLYYTTVPPDLRVGHYHYARVLYPEGQLACLGCIHTPTCHQPDPKPCALLTTPEMAWNHVVFVHENDPPWSLMPHREAWQQIQTGKQLAEAV
jgi:ADP-heptose:LPS heptosyltransferase